MLNFPFVCRLCLVPTSPNNSIEIFDETNEIPEKILELTDIQGAWGMPATVQIGTANAPSYGTQFQADFSKNLAAVMNNLHSGATTLATPSITFGLDTVPNIIQQGISTATDRVNKIAAASKEGIQKIGVGAGHAIGGGGVLGSSIAGAAMQVAGHGLGVGVNVADAGAKAGIDLLGHVGDNTASGISVGTTIGGNALSTLGNGMIAAGTGVNVMSAGLATLLDVIGSRLSTGIINAEQVIAGLMDAGVLKLENGALSFSTSAQANVYNILNSFLQILVNVQKLFDSLRLNINAGVTTPSVNGTAASTAKQTISGAAGGTRHSRQIDEPAIKFTKELEEPEIEAHQAEEVETLEPESAQLESAQSESTELESAQPELETGEPKVTAPQDEEVETFEPESAQLESAQPELPELETEEPEVEQLEN